MAWFEAHEQAELVRIVLEGPDPESGLSAFTPEDLVRISEARFSKTFYPASLGRLLKAMQAFLDRFSKTLAEDDHAVVLLPAYSPELNPVQRIWLYFKERFFSHRLLNDYVAILDAASNAWNSLLAEGGRIKSLCSYPGFQGQCLGWGGITTSQPLARITSGS